MTNRTRLPAISSKSPTNPHFYRETSYGLREVFSATRPATAKDFDSAARPVWRITASTNGGPAMNRRDMLRFGVGAIACAAIAHPARAAPSFDRFRVPEWSRRRRFVSNGFGRIAFIDQGDRKSVV